MDSPFDRYLKSTQFIDSEHPDIQQYAKEVTKGKDTPLSKAVSLYNAVRDDIWYDPYRINLHKDQIKASIVLARGSGYCVEKALLLAATGRAAKIPLRLGFTIVKNHLASERYLEILKTDKFVFHGYNEFFINGKWVKCTPAFNKDLCERYSVEPLEFDGIHDSIFQEFDKEGSKYMEYLHDYGTFDDLPYDLFVDELRAHYGHLFESSGDDDESGWKLSHPF